MPDFSNKDYLLANLPARYRAADEREHSFVARPLDFYGETLDEWDESFERFFENIDPETAPENFIDFWLHRLFGWEFFPRLFTLRQKRTLYANFARHLARRGTARGIELWLRDFGCIAKVWLREDFWGEFDWGEPGWNVSGPLLVLVEVIAYRDWNSQDTGAFGENFYGEDFVWGEPPVRLSPQELFYLLEFVVPAGQQMTAVWRRYEQATITEAETQLKIGGSPPSPVDPSSAFE